MIGGNLGDYRFREVCQNMETKIVRIRREADAFDEEEEEGLRQAGETIKRGGLVAFPTEPVYGLGGDALNPESARKIYAAKGRPSDNPLIVHISRFEDICGIVEYLPETAEIIADAFWPGPLTMILPKSDKVPSDVTGGLNTVAVRFPSHPAAKRLIAYSGGYVAAPSANVSGRPSPTTAEHVVKDMKGRIEMIVDGGKVGIGLESTIIDLTAEVPCILRPGYVTREMLGRVLGKVDTDVTIIRPDSTETPKAPGMKYRHYAPAGALVIVEGEPHRVVDYVNRRIGADRACGEKTGVLVTEELRGQYEADVIKCIGSRSDEEGIARNLFSALREFDEEGVTRIYSESFSSQGLGQAIMNRLLKAAGHQVVRLQTEL